MRGGGLSAVAPWAARHRTGTAARDGAGHSGTLLVADASGTLHFMSGGDDRLPCSGDGSDGGGTCGGALGLLGPRRSPLAGPPMPSAATRPARAVARVAVRCHRRRRRRSSASCVVAPSGIPYALLVGHTNGEVVQLPLPGGPPRPAVHRASKRHRGVVTDLLALRSASGERACFVSASSAGEVMMWALQSMTPLCSFSQHASGVHTLTMPPAGVPLHMEAWVLAVGDDGAISIYDALPPPAASSSSGGGGGSGGSGGGGGACASGRGASGGDDLPRLPSTFDSATRR